MNTLLLSNDLMLSSQVTQVARQMGAPLTVVSSSGQLIDSCKSDEFQQVILDLNFPQADANRLVSSIRSTGSTARIVAIAPHVQTAKIEAARESGCEAVLTKGQFHSTMQDWFSGDA